MGGMSLLSSWGCLVVARKGLGHSAFHVGSYVLSFSHPLSLVSPQHHWAPTVLWVQLGVLVMHRRPDRQDPTLEAPLATVRPEQRPLLSFSEHSRPC